MQASDCCEAGYARSGATSPTIRAGGDVAGQSWANSVPARISADRILPLLRWLVPASGYAPPGTLIAQHTSLLL